MTFECPNYNPYLAGIGDPAKAAEHLEYVADRFESGTLAWVQGSYGHPHWEDGPTACLIGGIRGLSVLAESHIQLAFKAVSEIVDPTGGWRLAAWNDFPGRTKEQVIDLLKWAAKELRNTT